MHEKLFFFKEVISLNWLKVYFKESIWHWIVSVEKQLPGATIQDFVFMHFRIWYNVISVCVAASLTSSSPSNPPNHCSKELHVSCSIFAATFNVFCFACKKYFKTLSWYLYVVAPSWSASKKLVDFTLDKMFLSIRNSNIKFGCALILLCKRS